MSARRRPAVAGRFYPADPDVLASTVDELLAAVPHAQASTATGSERAPSAVVVPHAGYMYSGAVAAHAYARVAAGRSQVERVVLLGPAHYVPTRIALSSADAFVTPLGDIPLDRSARDLLSGLDDVVVDDAAHAPEH